MLFLAGSNERPARDAESARESDGRAARGWALGLKATSAQGILRTALDALPRVRARIAGRALSMPMLGGVALSVPLVAAIVSLSAQSWAPVFDLALIEQKVRDVCSVHTPLLGLAGRLGPLEQPGRHPGPLGFYLLAPVYRLLQSSAWALATSMAALNIAVIFASLFVARRRGGSHAVILTAIGLAWLMQGHGLSPLTQPWNPYLPLLWFALFLLAVWSVCCRDLAMLPVAVASASVCMQSHIPYVAVCGGLGALAVIAAAITLARSPRASPERRQMIRWIVSSSALFIVLWLPPFVEQATEEPGNVSILLKYFANPPSAPVGIRAAVPLVLAQFDAWHIVVQECLLPGGFVRMFNEPQPDPERGAASVLVWCACFIASFRLKNPSLSALHAVAFAGVVVAVLAVSRIIGGAVPHVMLSVWAIGVLVTVASLSTVGLALARIVPLRRLGRAGLWLGSTVVVLLALRLTLEAPDVRPVAHRSAEQLQALLPRTIEALESGFGAATGRRGHYLVTWFDGFYGGAQGFGLANELERAGFDVGLEPVYTKVLGVHRIVRPKEATARVHFVNGAWIRRMRRVRGARQIARADLRTPEEREEFARTRARLENVLQSLGRKDVIASMTYDPIGAQSMKPPLPPLVVLEFQRMLEIGDAAAVFIVPLGGKR